MTGGKRSRDDRRRREILATLGASAVVGLAGCSGDDGENTATAAPTTTGGATDAVTETPTNAASETTTAEPTETATETATPTPIEEGGPPGGEGWQLTFQDRFDGGELDTGRWSYGMGGGTVRCPPQDGPNHCWAEDHAWVDGETDRLMLQASDEEPEGDADYTFGAVASDPHFTQQFGYFEAKCRMGDASGTLPAFWMLSDFTEHRYRELTFEARGVDDGESLHFGYFIQDEEGTMHENPTDAGGGEYGGFETALDESFHLLGIEWGPESIAFHVDGEEVARWDGEAVTEHFPGAPMYLICNNGVMEGADWVGYPGEADFPSYNEVEWVRAWQHDEWA